VGAVPEVNVAAAQPGQLGDPQAGLNRDHQQCAVTATYPPAGVRREQLLDLRFVEERDDCPVAAFGWDSQHPGYQIGVLGVAQRGEAEQGVDRGQAGVAAAHAVAALVSRWSRNAPINGA
jgi:hypothetical protein